MLDALCRSSAALGANPLLVQGPGGNTSIKLGERLWVKSSGAWLAEARERPIFVELNLPGVRRRLSAGEADPVTAEVCNAEQPNPLRPSIETAMHALMPHKAVIHVHSVNAIAHAVRSDGREILSRVLLGMRWAWVPYARPGLPLARAVAAAVLTRPDVLILANHGLVVGGESIHEAMDLLEEVERRISLAPRPAPPPDRAALMRLAAVGGYRLPAYEESHAIATDPVNLGLATGGSLYPDHVVFLGASPLVSLDAERALEWISANATSQALGARLLLVRGVGVLVREDAGRGAEQMVRCLALVLPRIDPDAPVVYLDAAEEAELLDWDAEQHRQAVDRMSSWS